jgi:uncharacterized protein YjbI with pentapeptide repeats
MSEYTTRQVLDMIQAHGGPKGLDLSAQDLRRIDLSHDAIQAELAQVRATDPGAEPAWLDQGPSGGGITLAEANLQNAALTEADLQGASLRGADLQEAYLTGAHLRGADLRGATLQGAYLGEADLRGAVLREAALQEVNLEMAHLQRADLRAANLERANLWRADLQGANLGKATLQGANLGGADLRGANLGAAHLQGANLWRTSLQGANVRGADLREARLRRANLQMSNLWRADLQGANLEGAHLQGANLRRADLEGANLGRADLHRVNLAEAVLRGANLWRADLQGANLRYADLAQVALLDAESIAGVHLYRAKLDHTALTRDQLGGAIGEELAAKWSEARDVYLALKDNFEQLGRYDDAAWAYQKERRMEKITKAPWHCREYYGQRQPLWRPLRSLLARRWPQALQWQYGGLSGWSPLVWWFWSRYTLEYLADWLVELLCGYGESIWRVLLWIPVALLGFAAYYWWVGGVWLVDSASGSLATAPSFWHYVTYSAGALTTTGFARYVPADDRVRFITALQAFVGVFLGGLLGFVAGHRIRRS